MSLFIKIINQFDLKSNKFQVRFPLSGTINSTTINFNDYDKSKKRQKQIIEKKEFM